MALAQAILSASNTPILLVAEGEEWCVISVTMCNTTSSPETVTLHAVPANQSASQSTTILDDMIIEPHGTKVWEHRLVLSAGEELAGIASFGGRVSVTVSFHRFN